MNAPTRPCVGRVTIDVPVGLQDRWERVVERVAARLDCSVEESRTLASATIVSRGIQHLERMG